MKQGGHPFNVLGINHTGLAPKDPNRAADFLINILKLKPLGSELVASQKTHTSLYSSCAAHADGPRLEILSDDGTGTSPIAKFLEKKGAGIHHLALTVDKLDEAIAFLIDQGIRMIDQVARPGTHCTRIAFVHPESTGGLLIELVEEQSHIEKSPSP